MKETIELLNVTNVITPADSKTNISHVLTINEEFDSVIIEFSYSPKKLEDEEKSELYIAEGLAKYAPEEYKDGYGTWKDYMPLVNLATISVDCNGEYIGCAHRHKNLQKHIISPSLASPGFNKSRISKGIWNFVINVHAVVTDTCEYQLKVLGESENDELVCL